MKQDVAPVLKAVVDAGFAGELELGRVAPAEAEVRTAGLLRRAWHSLGPVRIGEMCWPTSCNVGWLCQHAPQIFCAFSPT